MVAPAQSPASSPRLPSPPPIAEDQLGPKSPIAATEEQQHLFGRLDHGAARRIRPGTKGEDMAEGPPLVELSEIDSAFQLTEHLKALHNFLTRPIGSTSTIAIDKEMAHRLAQPPDNVDKTLWLYELCRFLIQKVNSIITALFSDNPPCSSITCPEMRASEWQYLCAVHDPPKSCCAIDYCCHTLDWAANTLASPKTFPSRLALGNDQGTQHQQIRQLTNIFRRVYRIFAHAWFQHRDMFWKVETRSGLYILFKTVCDVYGLIPEDNYTIPSEAEGIEAMPAAPPLILRREPSSSGSFDSENTSNVESVSDHNLSTAGTTKRHRHSPSVGATSVATVVEENEEEEDRPTEKTEKREVSHSEDPQGVSDVAPGASTTQEEPKAEKQPGGTDATATEVALPDISDSESRQALVETEKQDADEVKQEDDAPHTEEKQPEPSEDNLTAPEMPREAKEEEAKTEGKAVLEEESTSAKLDKNDEKDGTES